MTKAVVVIYFLVTRFAVFLVSLVAITLSITFLLNLIRPQWRPVYRSRRSSCAALVGRTVVSQACPPAD